MWIEFDERLSGPVQGLHAEVAEAHDSFYGRLATDFCDDRRSGVAADVDFDGVWSSFSTFQAEQTVSLYSLSCTSKCMTTFFAAFPIKPCYWGAH